MKTSVSCRTARAGARGRKIRIGGFLHSIFRTLRHGGGTPVKPPQDATERRQGHKSAQPAPSRVPAHPSMAL